MPPIECVQTNGRPCSIGGVPASAPNAEVTCPPAGYAPRGPLVVAWTSASHLQWRRIREYDLESNDRGQHAGHDGVGSSVQPGLTEGRGGAARSAARTDP